MNEMETSWGGAKENDKLGEWVGSNGVPVARRCQLGGKAGIAWRKRRWWSVEEKPVSGSEG